MPWFWFMPSSGRGCRLIRRGALLAGFRTEPLVDGPRRAVDPVRRRRISDYYGRYDRLRLRLSAITAVLSLVLAAGMAAGAGTATADRALLACTTGVVIVAAHHWVVALVVARPMVTSSTEGLLWQKAVLARTVGPMPHLAIFAAIFSAVIAVYASVVDFQELSLPTLLLSAGVAVLATASVVVVALAIREEKRALLRSSAAP